MQLRIGVLTIATRHVVRAGLVCIILVSSMLLAACDQSAAGTQTPTQGPAVTENETNAPPEITAVPVVPCPAGESQPLGDGEERFDCQALAGLWVFTESTRTLTVTVLQVPQYRNLNVIKLPLPDLDQVRTRPLKNASPNNVFIPSRLVANVEVRDSQGKVMTSFEPPIFLDVLYTPGDAGDAIEGGTGPRLAYLMDKPDDSQEGWNLFTQDQAFKQPQEGVPAVVNVIISAWGDPVVAWGRARP